MLSPGQRASRAAWVGPAAKAITIWTLIKHRTRQPWRREVRNHRQAATPQSRMRGQPWCPRYGRLVRKCESRFFSRCFLRMPPSGEFGRIINTLEQGSVVGSAIARAWSCIVRCLGEEDKNKRKALFFSLPAKKQEDWDCVAEENSKSCELENKLAFYLWYCISGFHKRYFLLSIVPNSNSIIF